MSELGPEFIEWRDSAGPHGWVGYEPGGSKPSMTCWTTGYVIQETDREITVSGSLGFDGSHLSCVHSPLSIPKIAIVRRVVVGGDVGLLRAENSSSLVKADQ